MTNLGCGISERSNDAARLAVPQDPRKVFVGKLIVQLIRRGWRPPRQMPPAGMDRLLYDLESIPHNATLELSPFEAEVLNMFAQGHGYESIAEDRGVTKETIKTQMKFVRDKLGANNTTHAVAIAIRRGVI
jgi:DNA-binding CsgD family transcriptional regulator